MSQIARKIGILTGGGDCPGLNAVIRAAVHRLIRTHHAEVYGIEDAFIGLLDNPRRLRHLEYASVSEILTRGGTILGTSNRGDPFAFPVVERGQVRLVDRSDELVAAVQELGFHALICIGGDGTLRIAERLFREKGVPVVGVPKTIDNDVEATDYTFGYWTAVQTATHAIDMLHSTAESHDRIMIVELMGRDAGHLALAAGIAGGADVILIPEVPFSLDAVVAKVEERKRFGQNFSIIAVAEGAYPEHGSVFTEALPPDQAAGRAVKLGGIGKALADRLGERTQMECRVTVLGHLQRGGSPGAFDRVLATTFGVKAADAAAAGNFGSVVTLQTPRVETVPLTDAIRRARPVDLKSDWIEAAGALGVCLGNVVSG